MDIFHQKTDLNNGLTMQEIINELNKQDISADRKILYQDFELLRNYGLKIRTKKIGRSTIYKLESRRFELAEVKLLVDLIQSAKFITEGKSRELIRKLETLVSTHEAKQLHRHVVVAGRTKATNEAIYDSVDQIHTAINKDMQIKFQYYHWNRSKEKMLAHDGDFYRISPWELLWNNENYYLIGYDSSEEKIKHFRVDRMLNLTLCSEKRIGRTAFEKMNLPEYSKKLFGMFDGEEMSVILHCSNKMTDAIIDRFGEDTILIPVDNDHFRATVDVFWSQQFIGWLVGLGSRVKIIYPPKAVQEMKEEAKRLQESYSSDSLHLPFL